MGCKCKGLPIPKTFVRKKLSLDRKEWFMKNQYAELHGDSYNETTSLDLRANDFISMIVFFNNVSTAGFLRIFFATCSEEGSPNVPEGLGNKMTLLFAPVEKEGDPINNYFFIAPSDPFNPEGSILNSTIANEWKKNYQNKQLTVFNKYVEHISDNWDAQTHNYSDTKSVIYDMRLMNDLVTEVSCQAAYGIRIHFCSYLDTDKVPPFIIPKRLVTHFGLIDDSNNDYFPDDHDQSCRPPLNILDYDNGQLCPTYCY